MGGRLPLVTQASAGKEQTMSAYCIDIWLLQLTNDELSFIQTLITSGMVPSGGKHVHDTFACPLLAKLHLQNSIVNGLPCYLPSEHVQLAMRDFEVCRRVFVLFGIFSIVHMHSM